MSDVSQAAERGTCDARELVETLRDRGPSGLREALEPLHEAKVDLTFDPAPTVSLPAPADDLEAYVKALAAVPQWSAERTAEHLWLADIAEAWADVRGGEDQTAASLRASVGHQLRRQVLSLAKRHAGVAAKLDALVATGNEVADRFVRTASLDPGEDLFARFGQDVSAAMAEANTAAFHAMSIEMRVYLAQFWSDHETVLGPEQVMEWGHRMWEDGQGSDPDVEPKMRISKRACGLHKFYCAVDRVDTGLARELVGAMAHRREEVAPNLRCHSCIGSALADLRLEHDDPAGAVEALERTLPALDAGMRPRRVALLLIGMRCGVALSDRALCDSFAERIEPVLAELEAEISEDGRSPIDRAWVAQHRLEVRFHQALAGDELEAAEAAFREMEARGESEVADRVDMAIDWVAALDDREHNAAAVKTATAYAEVARERGRLGRARRLVDLALRCCEDEGQIADLEAQRDELDERLRSLRERWSDRLAAVDS